MGAMDCRGVGAEEGAQLGGHCYGVGELCWVVQGTGCGGNGWTPKTAQRKENGFGEGSGLGSEGIGEVNGDSQVSGMCNQVVGGDQGE